MPHLSLALLGTFEATLDGEPVTAFGSDKARALLAFLAVESACPHRRAELAGLFWPDLSEKRAAHNLSQTLFRLRRALREPKGATESESARPSFLSVTPQDLQFNPHSDHQLDVALFSELLRASRQHQHPDAQACATCMGWLRQAADLYRGDLLAGFFVQDSVGFEEWRLVQQEMLHRQAVELLSRLATYHEGRGEHERVRRYAGQLVALEPWHEHGLLQWMRALARSGQTAAALEKYAAYCGVLAEEFGLAPSAEAKALCEQIRSGQVGRGAASEPAARRAAGSRRQVTALIRSHRDSTGSDDPEALHERLARCEPGCLAILERYGGYRGQGHGGECLVYFGYPRAYEDAARRAVHAGLAMVAAATAADPARIGIHTGAMVVGSGGEGSTEARGPIGDVPAIAQGCQALAGPGEVLITTETERLVRGWFRGRELGARRLAGRADPVMVYQVLGESETQSRLAWLAQTRGLASFVGREPELDRLLALDDEVRGGSGHAA